MAPTLGLGERPLGPAQSGNVTTRELYRAILEDKPYPIRGLIGFGSNMLLAHVDGGHGREALAALDFYAHCDLFMTPTAELADVVLPVASCFEREALRIGFDVSPEAQSLAQFRPAVVPPLGEARPDTDIVFDLAARLGLGAQFWDGDIEAAYRHQLAPTWHHARAVARRPERPAFAVANTLRETRRAGRERQAARLRHTVAQSRTLFADFPRSWLRAAAGFHRTADRSHGAARSGRALPAGADMREADAVLPDPASRAAQSAPARSASRGGSASRRRARSAASPTATGWRSRHRKAACEPAPNTTTASIPRVVVGEHGWWQACEAIGAPGYDPFGPGGANLNLIIGAAVQDPVSGTASHRAYLCEIRRAALDLETVSEPIRRRVRA